MLLPFGFAVIAMTKHVGVVGQDTDIVENASKAIFGKEQRGRRCLFQCQSIQLGELVADPKSTSSVIDFLRRCNLFEDFCGRLLREAPFASLVGSTPDGVVTISLATVNSVSDQFEPLILAAAQASFRETGQRMLKYKERYLLELLGASLYGRGKRTNSIEMRHRSLSHG